jgi:F-type H+-transporting ATPase subunit delta
MAEPQTLARPYARAAFEVAREAGAFDRWSKLLEDLAEALRQPTLAALVGDPKLGRGPLAELLVEVVARDAPREAQALIRLLVDNRRLQLAPFIAEQFHRLREAAEARVEVEITVAAPVGEPQKDALVHALRERLQRDLQVQWHNDESLIGGAVIRAGDLVIDGSVRGELQRLSQALQR